MSRGAFRTRLKSTEERVVSLARKQEATDSDNSGLYRLQAVFTEIPAGTSNFLDSRRTIHLKPRIRPMMYNKR
jgi:hypothetical protein